MKSKSSSTAPPPCKFSNDGVRIRSSWNIGLPGMSGYEAARQIRQLSGENPARLIALTGYGQESDRKKALEAGFDAHLIKPVDPEALQALLVG